MTEWKSSTITDQLVSLTCIDGKRVMFFIKNLLYVKEKGEGAFIELIGGEYFDVKETYQSLFDAIIDEEEECSDSSK